MVCYHSNSESDDDSIISADGIIEGDQESEFSEDDDIGDHLRSFEEAFDQEDRLRLDSAADVSLDMDLEDLGLDEDVEAASDDSDDDELDKADIDFNDIFR